MTDLKNLRIAVLGAGAVGGYIGGFLADAGYRVALVDAWADHVDKINADGLRLSDPLGSVTVRAEAMHLHQVQSFIRDPIDIALVLHERPIQLLEYWLHQRGDPFEAPLGAIGEPRVHQCDGDPVALRTRDEIRPYLRLDED